MDTGINMNLKDALALKRLSVSVLCSTDDRKEGLKTVLERDRPILEEGNTGCRIVVSLIHEMEKRGLKLGLAALCGGSGHGKAILIERA